MSLPWINTTSNKSYRAWRNGIYGSALTKVYPPGVFYVSNTNGAPGQPNAPRILPAGNQVADPRSTIASYVNLATTTTGLQGLIAGGPTNINIGGNSTTTGQPGNVTPSFSENWILYGAIALMLWAIFRG